MANHTIVFADIGKKHKVCKIVFYSDGGFGVFVPYHHQKQGLLVKYIFDYNYTHESCQPKKGIEYRADDIVKLTVHYDGYTQFSHVNENNIVSGRTKILKLPKGLGLQSQPLSNPIQSGPTFGVLVWGLSEFQEMVSTQIKNTVEFIEDDYYYRSCTDIEWNGGYLIEGFIFKKEKYWKHVKIDNEKLSFTVRAYNYLVEPGKVFNFKVVQKEDLDYFIALSACKIKHGFESESGFLLGSSSELIPPSFYGEKKAMFLQAFYPPPFNLDSEMMDLNYKPKT